MWLQLKFSLFGREICSLTMDRAAEEQYDDHKGEFFFEDDNEEEEEEGEDSIIFRWGEHPLVERVIFSPVSE